MTLVEKMARAMTPTLNMRADNWRVLMPAVIAAVNAMRELTPATLEATVSAFNDYESAFETPEETVARILGSLIDAAIKEAEGE